MLKSLYVLNYALIDKLETDFNNGMSVITGETGAGKSIMLGALGLLLGQRADIKSIRKGENKCLVEACFDISSCDLKQLFEDNDLDYDDECVLRREVYATGKSRAFINDSPVQLSQMKAVGERLIDIHSQHQNMLLNSENFQLGILDTLAKNDANMTVYKQLYKEWKKVANELERLRVEEDKNKGDEDYVRYQLEQLCEVNLQEEEQDLLEQEQELLNHAEEIKSYLFNASQLMEADDGGLLTRLRDCLADFRNAGRNYPKADALADRIDSAYIELKDIAQETGIMADSIEFDQGRLEEVSSRLNVIYQLEQKHQVSTVSELLSLAEGYKKRLDSIESYGLQIETLDKQLHELYSKLVCQAKKITEARQEAAEIAETQIKDKLLKLGMPNANMKIRISELETPGINGADSVCFMFSANKNGILQDIASVASGGEISRVMLSIKAMIAGVMNMPTIIFDEIDTGVSGEIASRMAEIMEEMCVNGCQVITITHLPQIAAHGTDHYKVYKKDNETETISNIRHLSKNERIEELARMLSGTTLTDAALNNARVLLEGNER